MEPGGRLSDEKFQLRQESNVRSQNGRVGTPRRNVSDPADLAQNSRYRRGNKASSQRLVDGYADGPSPAGRALTGAEICVLARQGDPLAQRAVEREGYYLGVGLANIVTLFTPDTIILGGGVMKSSHLFLDCARQVIRETCTQVPAEKTRLTLASLGANVGLAGAAQAWIHRYC